MDTTESPAANGLAFGIPNETSSWLLRAFPHSSQSNIILRAVLGSIAILGIEYSIEVIVLDLPYWQSRGSFLADPGVPLSAIGLVFSLIVLGQWGQRYVDLWEEVRPGFDISAESYEAAVHRSLDGLYGRDHVPFFLFVAVQIAVYTAFGHELPAGYLHVGFVHFFAVTALYNFYRHTVVINQISKLDLVHLDQARQILARIADFSVVVCLNWFAALAALAVYLGVFTDLERGVILFYALVLLLFVVVGFLVFVIPIVVLHEALTRVKRSQLHAIDKEISNLFESWRAGELDGDPAIGLDILEARREKLEASSTWPYRVISVGEVVLGSVIPVVLSAVQVLGV